MEAGSASSTLRSPRSAPPEKSFRLRRPKSGLDRVTDAVLPTGESPHRIDGIHGPGRDGLAGIYRERTTGYGETAGSSSALPDRHLRFDSPTESRFTSLVPAGSPFLAEARLQSLLDEAQPDLPLAVTTGSPARALSNPGDRVIEWSTGAVESGRGAIAAWSRGWQQTASRSKAMRRDVLELLSGAANTMHGMVEVLLGHRPARP